MKPFRWGIFGTGAVSAKFILGLAAAKDAVPQFIASRSAERARHFARILSIQNHFEGYSNALAACPVDAVYIATPPSEHVVHALLCLNAGVPILVEKPFATSRIGAMQIAKAARDRSVFAMEAMWTRFLPAAQALRDQINLDVIGDIQFLSGNFCTSQKPDGNGMFDPVLGGGALSHLAAYPLSLAQWLFGDAEVMSATGTIGATGVDEDAAMLLRYRQNTVASFQVSLRSWAPDDFFLAGSHGVIAFDGSIVRPHGLRLTREAPRSADTAQLTLAGRLRQRSLTHQIAQRASWSGRGRWRKHRYYYTGNGYHYEADEVRSRVRSGAGESLIMPLDDSVSISSTVDRVRRLIITSNTKEQ